MKEVKHVISEEHADKFTGSFVVKVPKRAERCNLQYQAKIAGETVQENPTAYYEFSEKILDNYFVSVDVVKTECCTVLKSREDMEYMEVEWLISLICQIVVGGERMGKKIA
jgi:hypothetical protein